VLRTKSEPHFFAPSQGRLFEEADPSSAAIETVYGVGYRWVA
jgi:hypothetical protein